MSWLKAVSRSEDVFDEDADELSLQSREWTSNMKKRLRDGYVDGMDTGEEGSLQAGFNLGFAEGATQTIAVGRLKGIISAISCWCQIQHPEGPVPASVRDLLQQVSKHEDSIMVVIKAALENPLPSLSSVSESMENLDVKQAGSGCCGGEGCKETGRCGGEGCKETGRCGGEGCKETGRCGGEGCKETGRCGGEGCKETDCHKKGEKMDLDVPHQQPKLCSGSTDCSSSSSEILNNFLQRCMDLVSELGLPQELIGHIEELKNM